LKNEFQEEKERKEADFKQQLDELRNDYEKQIWDLKEKHKLEIDVGEILLFLLLIYCFLFV
jgi:hypothetical protein